MTITATAAKALTVFYDLLIDTIPVIYRYNAPGNVEGEYIVLNHIPNTREKGNVLGGKVTHSYGITYINLFIPKINNGTDVYPDSKQIETYQTTIIDLIESFKYDSSTERINAISIYLDGDPIVNNDNSLYSNLIFRVITNYS